MVTVTFDMTFGFLSQFAFCFDVVGSHTLKLSFGLRARARGLARGRIGQDPPRQGWRTQDHILAAAIDGPVNYAHLMSSEAFGAPN